jgi:hypothetical protein
MSAEDRADQHSYVLKVDSSTKRIIGSESYDIDLTNGISRFSYNKSTEFWSEKKFNGTFETVAIGHRQEIDFNEIMIERTEAEVCFTTSGQVSGTFVFTKDSKYDFSVEFAETNVPNLKFDGFEERFDLKVLNCIN